MLKSVDRINRMIDEGKIKSVFVFDGWHTHFVKKIEELFGNRVEVCIIRNSIRNVEGMRFNNSDCIIFFETSIKDYGEAKEYVLKQAKHNDAYVKVLTEDIFMCHRHDLSIDTTCIIGIDYASGEDRTAYIKKVNSNAKEL